MHNLRHLWALSLWAPFNVHELCFALLCLMPKEKVWQGHARLFVIWGVVHRYR